MSESTTTTDDSTNVGESTSTNVATDNSSSSSSMETTPPVTPQANLPNTTSTESKSEINETKVEKKENEGTPATTSVAGFGVCSDQNWKYRRRMEDAHYIEDGFNGKKEQGFFGVYDGHGGKEAANFASQNVHKILAEMTSNEDFSDPEKVTKILKDCFLETDEKMKTAVPSHHGCTAVTCLLTGSLANNDRQLWTANVGDARAVLCRDGKAIRLTEEHKASEEKEQKRITEIGGFIINGRVNGQIIVTRSLGDHLMKDYIIGYPYTSHYKLTDKDTWLIVACDGLWDVIEDQQSVDFVLEHQTLTPTEISKKLLIKALQEGTTDNLSIVVVKL